MLATVSDRKLIVEDLNSSLIWGLYYAADVLSVQDYYGFGAGMEGRSWSRKRSRFGFQGQEIDSEFLGGAVSYKYRVHDPRIGRFFSIDPLAAGYPHNSPYAFSENKVIAFRELEGLESAPSTYFGDIGLGSFGHGIMDGLLDASPAGMVKMLWSLKDSEVRDQFVTGIKMIIADPVGGSYPAYGG